MKKTIIKIAKKLIPKRINQAIFNFGFHVAPDQFEKFCYLYGNSPKMEMGLQALKNRGFEPKNVFDIGAFEGTFCRMARRIWPNSEIIMFEANREKEALLKSVAIQENAELNISLLGPVDGQEVEFFVMDSGSSVLEENSPLERKIVKEKTDRLDTVARDRQPDFMKLDVQGFELQVLLGADKALQSAEAVVMEVSLIEINSGAPLLAEVVGFMADRGFEVADILEIHRRPLDQATNQVDLFFVKSDHHILADRRHYA